MLVEFVIMASVNLVARLNAKYNKPRAQYNLKIRSIDTKQRLKCKQKGFCTCNVK